MVEKYVPGCQHLGAGQGNEPGGLTIEQVDFHGVLYPIPIILQVSLP